MAKQAQDHNPCIVALDVQHRQEAEQLVEQLQDIVDFFKIGMELFTAHGPQMISALKARGCRVFLDLKYHDIPNTVRGAVRAAAAQGVDMMTVHGGGGLAMLEAAAEAAGAIARPPILLGVTVLTSIDDTTLQEELGVDEAIGDYVLRLGKLAMAGGLAGVVASPREVRKLRQVLGAKAVLVVPGIRPVGHPGDDQRRTATPKEAKALGADYLVIGRAITGASDPRAAAKRIISELRAEE